jgi:ATP-binding cassette, subfamily B, bacterial
VAALAGSFLSLLESLLTYGSTIASARVGEFVGRDIRFSIMRRLLTLGQDFHEEFDTGELSSRLSSDVDRIQDNVLLWATGVVPDVALLLGMLTVVSLVDIRLALVVVVVLPPLLALTKLRRRLTRDAQAKIRRAGGQLDSTTIEQLRRIPLAQLFTREGLVRTEYAFANDEVVSASLAGNRTQARFRPPTDLILSLGATVVIVFGVTQIRSGHLTTGTLLVVLSYLSSVYGPIRRLAGVSASSAKAAASAERIGEVMNARPSVRRGPLALTPQFRRELRLEHVEARYPNGFVALRDIDLTIRPGERICVVGRSGAGKSTFLAMIPRLIEPSAGHISVDGVHLSAVNLDIWRGLVAMVPQETGLIQGSIASNIAFGLEGVSHDDIVAAAQTALVDEFVADLPNGYDTIVGTDGTRLSGGQRRRVALARALVRKSPILLLDEPTTGLDGLSEELVIAAIRRASANRTCITVTHRTDLALEFDRIVVLDGGRIVEMGTPEQLMSSGGLFERMRHAQSGAHPMDRLEMQRR